MPRHVPYRATSEIERSAGRLLAEYAAQRGVRLAPPIPVDDIVEKHLKLTLEFDDLHVLFDIDGRRRALARTFSACCTLPSGGW